MREQELIESREYSGFPNTMGPGQWVGGPRGTREEEIALWKWHTTKFSESMNAGGGG